MLTTTLLHVLLATGAVSAGVVSAGVVSAGVVQEGSGALALTEGLAVGKSAEGTLTLTNGNRLLGKVYKTRKGWTLKKGGNRRSFTDDEVQKFISRSDLLQEFDRLAGKTDTREVFAKAQLTIWAFENGLGEKAWPILGELYESNKKVPNLAKIEDLAANDFLEEFSRRQQLDTKARRILLESSDVKGHPIRKAKNEVTPRALVRLLEMERQAMALDRQANNKKKVKRKSSRSSLSSYAKSRKKVHRGKVEQLLRDYSEEALSTHRRILARRALLEDVKGNQAFVYRLAVRFPEGPNRRDIIQEIFDQKLVDDAATYLSRQLRYDGPMLVKARTAEVLGDLGSPLALPALLKTKELLRSPDLKRKAGGGGGSRAYIAVTTQTSYIRDFSVEVAAAAAIANPEVDVIESGTVLDAKVLAVDWTRYIVYLDSRLDRAIKRIRAKQ